MKPIVLCFNYLERNEKRNAKPTKTRTLMENPNKNEMKNNLECFTGAKKKTKHKEQTTAKYTRENKWVFVRLPCFFCSLSLAHSFAPFLRIFVSLFLVSFRSIPGRHITLRNNNKSPNERN